MITFRTFSLFSLIMIMCLACSTAPNTKPPVTTSAVTARVPASAYDFSAEYRSYDRNRSGNIDRVEFEDHVSRYFDSLDINRDGRLSADEVKKQSGWHERILDINQDDNLNIVEFIGAADGIFDQADKNHDRKLSREEFEVGLKPHDTVNKLRTLPRVCVGDLDGRAANWTLFENRGHNPRSIKVFSTVIPTGQRWTCVPVSSPKKEYSVRVESIGGVNSSMCEAMVRANEWIEVQGATRLTCSRKK